MTLKQIRIFINLVSEVSEMLVFECISEVQIVNKVRKENCVFYSVVDEDDDKNSDIFTFKRFYSPYEDAYNIGNILRLKAVCRGDETTFYFE